MSKSNSEQKPTLMPPPNVKSKGAASGKATPMQDIDLSSEIKKGKNGSRKEYSSPVMTPLSTAKTGETVAVWSPATTINGIWCINEDKNAWINDPAVGWKQLSNLSDSGNVALTMLSSHAKQNGSSVTYRTEDDNLVHEIYVW